MNKPKLGYEGPAIVERNGKQYRVIGYMAGQGEEGTILGPNDYNEYYTIIENDPLHNRVLLGRTRPEDMDAALVLNNPRSITEHKLIENARAIERIKTGMEVNRATVRAINAIAKRVAKNAA